MTSFGTIETGTISPVPEPSTLLLLGTGLAATGVRRFRRTRSQGTSMKAISKELYGQEVGFRAGFRALSGRAATALTRCDTDDTKTALEGLQVVWCS